MKGSPRPPRQSVRRQSTNAHLFFSVALEAQGRASCDIAVRVKGVGDGQDWRAQQRIMSDRLVASHGVIDYIIACNFCTTAEQVVTRVVQRRKPKTELRSKTSAFPGLNPPKNLTGRKYERISEARVQVFCICGIPKGQKSRTPTREISNP